MIKLRKRKSTADVHVGSSLPKTPALTSAEKSKRYRDNLKKDPTTWAIFKEKERKRKQNERKYLTEEQKNKIKIGNRIRQARYRAKKKKDDKCSKPKQTVTKILTRKEKQKQRTYWREKQRECRAKHTAQKVRRKREKDKRYRSRIIAAKLRKYLTRKRYEEKITQLASNFSTSQQALRKAAYRLKKHIPKNPMKFAEVIDRLLNNASPRKQEALENRGILNSSSRKEKEMLSKVAESFSQRMKEGQISKAKIASACNIMKRYRFAKSTSILFGISPSYASRAENPEKETRKKRNDATSDDIRGKVQEYFKLPTVSTTIPDRKSVKKGAERKTIDRPVKDIYQDFMKENPDVKISFSTFSTLRPNNVETTKTTKWYSCLCETCTNVEMKIKAINLFAARKKLTRFNSTLKDKYEAINLTMCQKGENEKYHKKECIERNCQNCNSDMLLNHLQNLLEAHGGETVEYNKWENIKMKNSHGKEVNKIMIQRKKKLLNDIVIELSREVSELAQHLFIARWQQEAFSALVKDIPLNWVVLNLDFAENYSCVNQFEIQSAYWGHNQITIHPVVSYYNCPNCETGTTQEVLLFLSDDLTHDSHAVAAFMKKANEHLRDRGLNIDREIIFSDGCAGQYKSITPFMDVSFAMLDFGFPIEKHYYGSRHGKGPSDGAGAIIKNAARRAVKGEGIVINNAKDLYDFARKKLTRDDDGQICVHSKRTIFLTTASEINRNRPERVGKTVKGTRSLHAVKTVNPQQVQTRKLSCFCQSCINSQGDCTNKQYVDSWQSVQLYRRGERRARQVRGRGRGLGRGRRGNGRGRGQGNRNKAVRGRRRRGGRKHQHRLESDTDTSEEDVTMDYSDQMEATDEDGENDDQMEATDEDSENDNQVEATDEHGENDDDILYVTEDAERDKSLEIEFPSDGDGDHGNISSLSIEIPSFDEDQDLGYSIDLTDIIYSLTFPEEQPMAFNATEEPPTANNALEEQPTVDVQEVQPTANNALEERPTADNALEQPTADDVQEVKPTADNVQEVQPTADNVPKVQLTVDNVPEVQQTADNVQEVQPTADNVPEVQLTADNVPEVQQTANNVLEERSTADNALEEQSTADNVPEVKPTADNVPEVQPTADNVQEVQSTVSNAVKENYPTGTYLCLSHGNELFPVVVTDWPWIQYYNRRGNFWFHSETSYTCAMADIIKTLQAPDIRSIGRRMGYIFSDFPNGAKKSS